MNNVPVDLQQLRDDMYIIHQAVDDAFDPDDDRDIPAMEAWDRIEGMLSAIEMITSVMGHCLIITKKQE